jgi:hypothetical protein
MERIRKRRREKLGKPPLRISLEDLTMWAKTARSPMFSEALRECRHLGSDPVILWHSGGRITVSLGEPVKAMRKRKPRT